MRITLTLLIVASALIVIGTEVARSLVDSYRVKKYGLGGTQDVAIYGMLLLLSLLTAAAIFSILGWLQR